MNRRSWRVAVGTGFMGVWALVALSAEGQGPGGPGGGRPGVGQPPNGNPGGQPGGPGGQNPGVIPGQPAAPAQPGGAAGFPNLYPNGAVPPLVVPPAPGQQQGPGQQVPGRQTGPGQQAMPGQQMTMPFQPFTPPVGLEWMGGYGANQAGHQPGNTKKGGQGQAKGGQPPVPVTRDWTHELVNQPEGLLNGLTDMDPTRIKVGLGDVVNVRRAVTGKHLQSLIQALNGNAQASQNAQLLTQRLQDRGLLRSGDRVVGYRDGKVYALGAAIP